MRDDFRSARRSRRFHAFAQTVLVLTLLIGVTWLMLRQSWTIDLASRSPTALAPETKAILEDLAAPVRIIVSVSERDEEPEVAQAARDLRRLLRVIEADSLRDGSPLVKPVFIDVVAERRRAEVLGVSEPNLVLVSSSGRERRLFLNDLYATENRKRTAFLGERVLAAAILEVSAGRRPALYFLAGHGEMLLQDTDDLRGLSQLAGVLRQRNYALSQLDLLASGRVPDDAAAVLVPGPQAPLHPQVQEILRTYLSTQAGRVVLLLEPGRPHGLDDLLWDWGVLADDVLVLDPAPGAMTQNDNLVIRRLGDHEITRTLASNQVPVLLGLARPARPDPGRPDDAGLSVTPLLRTSDEAWGEREWLRAVAQGRRMVRDGGDIPGPLDVAVVSERRGASAAGIGIPGGRLVVIGSSGLANNASVSAFGNLTFFLSMIEWMVGRDVFLQVPPRPVQRTQLVITTDQQNRLRLFLLAAIPGVFAVMGAFVYLLRRR